MVIRRISFTIGFIHILTFRENYRAIIAPYFNYIGLEYAIENENTFFETIKLVYRTSGIILQFNKESATFLFEGEVSDVKKSNPIINIFFDIVEKFKLMPGFNKIDNHKIEIAFVEILEMNQVNAYMTSNENKFVHNPFKGLFEFGSILDFKNENKTYKFQFGNFNANDILQFNISPLQTKFNKELYSSVGLMCNVVILEHTNYTNFSKFKDLVREGEALVNQFLKIDNNEK